MHVVDRHFRSRTIGFALIAGVAVLGPVLALGSWLARSPHSPSTETKPEVVLRIEPATETVVAKASEPPKIQMMQTKPMAKAMHQAEKPTEPPPGNDGSQLKGLSEIPEAPPDRKPKSNAPKAFAAFSKTSEVLPWDQVEPVPFTPVEVRGSPQPAEAGGAKLAAVTPGAPLPVEADVENWVKAKVTKIKGEDHKKPLIHFELWLEPPAEMKQRLVGVAYDFNSPAIRPQLQSSSDKASGFRVSAGGLACADEITLTLRFNDGRSQKVAVDGCQLMG